jgi:hypothetical protein
MTAGAPAGGHFSASERREAMTYVPAAVMWEVCLLARTVRTNLRRSPATFFADLFSNPTSSSWIPRERRSCWPANSHSHAIRVV